MKKTILDTSVGKLDVTGLSGGSFSDGSGTYYTGEVGEYLEIRENNVREVESAINQAIAQALEEIGLTAEGYAKKECPVDTGRLRSSITHLVQTSEDAVYIGTNVEYAPYVELGTAHMKAQPFLVPAASEHSGTYRTILKSHLGSA
jgi:HK97 gp10 family phage protein